MSTLTLPRTARRLLFAASLASLMGFTQAASVAPLVTAVRPERLISSRNEQVISVVGKDFVPKVTISITDPAGNAQDVPPGAITDVKPATLRVTVTLPLDGDYTIVVTNPAGTPSNAFAFHVGAR